MRRAKGSSSSDRSSDLEDEKMRSIFEFHDIQQNIEDEKCVSVFFESVRVIRPEPREECISTLRVPTNSKTF